MNADDLIAAIDAAGVIGRGGAGFSTARKLAAVRRAAHPAARTGRSPVVIANAAEGEPASAKDRTLLTRSPELVHEGLALAAGLVGARRCYLYGPSPVFGDIPWVRPEPAESGRSFVAGEESAAVAAVEGRPARPRDKFRRIVEAGVGGAPTLVQNVETLAHLALVARHGPEWFRAHATHLTTVSGAVTRGGVFAARPATTLGELLDRAGGPTEPLQAVLVGGFHGAWVPPAAAVELSPAGLRPYGAAVGAGVIVALGASRCGLQASAHVARFLGQQTAGQCGPCVNGLPRLADALTRLAERRGTPAEAARLAAVVDGRGACRHPDGTARFIRSSLHMFSAEVTRHLAGQCSAEIGAFV
jgi:NADH:ubiquinone oxidoreductase subunit F (NADH-binding)